MMKITTNNFFLINTTATPDASGSVIQSLETMSIIIYSLVSVLGMLGNGVVIWVTGFKMQKTVNTVWYLNLAAADFLFAAFLPLMVTYKVLGFHWPFGKFMCKLNITLLLLNMFVSVYILVVISVDRCVSVVWPVWAQNHRNVRKASWVSLCIWMVATSTTVPSFLSMDTEQKSANKTICFDRLFDSKTRSHNQFRVQAVVITRFLLGFAVPFTVIVSCYAVIIHRLRKNRTLARKSSRPFKIITALIVTFFLCWAPAYIMNLINLKVVDTGNIFIGIRLANCLAILNSCMNPLLYVFMRQDFKDEVRKSILNALETAFQEEEAHPPTEHHTEQIEL